MSRLDIRIPPSMPESLSSDSLSTADSYIASRRVHEFRTFDNNAVVLDATVSNRVEFTISTDGFIDFSKSYLEFDFKVEVEESSLKIDDVALCTGGTQAMWKHWRLFDESGVAFDEQTEYSNLFGMTSAFDHSRSYVETIGQVYGDGLDPVYGREHGMQMSYLGKVISSNTAAGVVDLPQANRKLKVGDWVIIDYAATDIAVTTTYGPVKVLAVSATTFTITANGTALDPASGNALFIYKIEMVDTAHALIPALHEPGDILTAQAGQHITSARKVVCQYGATTRMCQYINLASLRMRKLFPARYLKNMKLQGELNPAFACLQGLYKSIGIKEKLTITLTNIRLVCNIVMPVTEVVAAWDDQWRSDQGLIYHWVSVFANIQQEMGSGEGTSATNSQFIIPCRVASARAVMCAIKPLHAISNRTGPFDDDAKTVEGYTWAYDKTGDSISANIQYYQYTIGTERFPWRGKLPVDTAGYVNFMNNLHVLGKDIGDEVRFLPSMLRATHPTPSEIEKGIAFGNNKDGGIATGQSRRCFLMADLSKEGFLTGANLRDANLMLEIERSSTPAWSFGPIYYFFYIPYDVIAKLNASETGVRKYF